MEVESIFKTIEKVVPFLANYENWVKWLVSIWIILTAIVLVSFLFPKKTSQKESQTQINPNPNKSLVMENIDVKKWEMTGDVVIDRVLKDLNQLEKKGKSNISQTELATILKPLFTRPAFYGIREENWKYFLYPLCKTRTILEFYVPYFESPNIRANINKAIKLMVVLQNDVAEIYGVSFSITEHINRYINSSKGFIDNMPNREFEPDYKFFDDRDKTIRKIKTILNEAGIAEKY